MRACPLVIFREICAVTFEKRVFPSAAMAAWLLCSGVGASAAPLDFIFGKKAADAEAAQPDPKQRLWRLAEFTRVELVPREQDAAANQHPAQWTADMLRRQLALVRIDHRNETQPLFGDDELSELAGALSQALALAGPADDVLLLSTNRRGGGVFVAPFGVTARLFVQDGSLQLIVNDTRLDFVDAYRGTHVAPSFMFGSRAKASKAVLRSASGASRRADWLSLPAGLPAAATPVAPAAAAVAPAGPAVAVAPATAAGPVAAQSLAPSPAAAPAAASTARPREPASADAIEQRLITLKRLLDRGLISEAEYQQMRRDVLQSL